jgi:hypothetical protein
MSKAISSETQMFLVGLALVLDEYGDSPKSDGAIDLDTLSNRNLRDVISRNRGSRHDTLEILASEYSSELDVVLLLPKFR